MEISFLMFSLTHIQVAYLDTLDEDQFCHLLAIPSKERLTRVLKYLLDENEFLSPYGIRSLSKIHEKYPFVMHVGGEEYRVSYVPGESNTHIFGGNSNWRGPIWLCGKLTSDELVNCIPLAGLGLWPLVESTLYKHFSPLYFPTPFTSLLSPFTFPLSSLLPLHPFSPCTLSSPCPFS